MLHGVFVTGTDTGIGKTVVSAALMLRYRPSCPSLRYWKPVQTGIEHDDDTADVVRLSGGPPGMALSRGIRLERPVSPHLAARVSGVTINVGALQQTLADQPPGRWIVEGAGGALVPLNDSELMVDLMSALKLPVLVVSRAALGTINHTLLTLQALRARSLHVCGVVMVGARDQENRSAIEHYGKVAVLAEMPPFNPLTRDTLTAWATTSLDTEGALVKWLA